MVFFPKCIGLNTATSYMAFRPKKLQGLTDAEVQARMQLNPPEGYSPEPVRLFTSEVYMSRFPLFIAIGIVCFIAAWVFAMFNIVVVGPGYYSPFASGPGGGSATGSGTLADSRPGGSGGYYSVDEIRGWAPDVTNAGASAGFAIAGGLCMIAAAMTDRRTPPGGAKTTA